MFDVRIQNSIMIYLAHLFQFYYSKMKLQYKVSFSVKQAFKYQAVFWLNFRNNRENVNPVLPSCIVYIGGALSWE